MRKKNVIIGIDVSKLTLDLCILYDDTKDHCTIKNTAVKISSFLKKVKKLYPTHEIELVMENTGLYNWPLYKTCKDMSITIFVVNPLHLKRSMGMVRGKNDKIDAERIALFGSRFYDEQIPYKIPSGVIRKIKVLFALRARIMKGMMIFKAPLSELSTVAEKEDYKPVLTITNQLLKQLEKQLKQVEQELDNLIKADPELSDNYQLMTSVQGVGKVVAWSLLIKTNNFSSISNPKKLACYVGVVPFEHQSGTSINRKPRVSFMADKQLKKVLHMAAMRAVRLDGDLQKYYIRKVEEGKNKMLVLNAVRNKLIARICSVVNNKKMYQKNLVLS